MEPLLTSDSRADEPSAAIVRQAAEWLAHVESGDATEQDHRDLEAWRRMSPAHALALDRLGGVRERLERAPGPERETLRRLLSRPRRSTARAVLGVVALVGIGLAASKLPVVQLHFADQRTRPGETRVVDLNDGSWLTLSTDSAVDIDIDVRRRTVRLLRGEVLAQVAGQGDVPFMVTSSDGSAVALGTGFTVRKGASATTVAVIESHVRVCPARAGQPACVTLAPGQRARLTSGAVDRLPDAPTASIGAWADGWLTVDDRPLVEVLDELNHWRATPIGYDRRALSGLRVSGVFPLREPDKAVANLAQLLPITVDRSDPAAPVIRRR